MQQIERDCFSVAKRRSIYMTLAFLALLGAPYIYEISSLSVKYGDIEDMKRFLVVEEQ